MPGFADWCGVELVASDGGLDQVALAHVDPDEVGGDFYDIIQLGDSWLSFVGDVAGKGAGAAALTARARYTMISVAQLTGRADSAVDRVNDAFLDMDGSSLCTLAALRLPGAEPGGQVEILSAGHPLPYLVPNDGAPRPWVPRRGRAGAAPPLTQPQRAHTIVA